jgi:hypothetical protein
MKRDSLGQYAGTALALDAAGLTRAACATIQHLGAETHRTRARIPGHKLARSSGDAIRCVGCGLRLHGMSLTCVYYALSNLAARWRQPASQLASSAGGPTHAPSLYLLLVSALCQHKWGCRTALRR